MLYQCYAMLYFGENTLQETVADDEQAIGERVAGQVEIGGCDRLSTSKGCKRSGGSNMLCPVGCKGEEKR
jgi:hypothetical protein